MLKPVSGLARDLREFFFFFFFLFVLTMKRCPGTTKADMTAAHAAIATRFSSERRTVLKPYNDHLFLETVQSCWKRRVTMRPSQTLRKVTTIKVKVEEFLNQLQ